jgi:hypothetical protein
VLFWVNKTLPKLADLIRSSSTCADNRAGVPCLDETAEKTPSSGSGRGGGGCGAGESPGPKSMMDVFVHVEYDRSS